MTVPVHKKRALIALAIVVVFVAVVVPTCRMVGCSVNGSMPWGHNMGTFGLFSDCGGTYLTNSTPSAVVPAGADTLVVAFIAAVMAALAFFRPPVVVQTVRSHSSDPPPPPEDPLGSRFRV